jgi:hypothetical protein
MPFLPQGQSADHEVSTLQGVQKTPNTRHTAPHTQTGRHAPAQTAPAPLLPEHLRHRSTNKAAHRNRVQSSHGHGGSSARGGRWNIGVAQRHDRVLLRKEQSQQLGAE